MKFPFLLFCSIGTLLLAGCDKTVTIKELCNKNLKVCKAFKADTWCKAERKDLLINYDAFNNSNEDSDRFAVLLQLEEYEKCMGIAAQIEHVKLKGKQENRKINLKNARKEINKLVNESKQSTEPHMLYYRWSRLSESKAISQLLSLEGSNALETPELQLIFATYYTKRNPQKTLNYLFHALELYAPNDKINTETFLSLSTIFTDKEEFKQAYIWLKVLILIEPENEIVSDVSLEGFAKQYQLNIALLNKVAAATLTKIQQGTFKAPQY